MDSAAPAIATLSPYGLPPEDLTTLLDQMRASRAMDPGLYRGPVPAVLDTDCVRTGLHYQLKNGSRRHR